MMWEITAALVAGVLTLLFLLYRKRQKQMRLFSTLGIPGPEPHWFHGNLQEYKYRGKRPFEALQSWTKTFGKFYGYYEGPIPVVVLSDPQMIKQVFIKQFNHIYARKEFALAPHPDQDNVHMFIANGAKWKRLRSIVNPMFSAAKLKKTFPLVLERVDILASKLEEEAQKNEPINITEFYQRLTLDVIGNVGFGMEISAQENPDEPFLAQIKTVFKSLVPETGDKLWLLSELMPELRRALWLFFLMTFSIRSLPVFRLLKKLGGIIDTRRKEGCERSDLLQLMMDAEASGDLDNAQWTMSTDDNEIHHDDQQSPKDTSKVPLLKKLKADEIVSQSFLFLIAGYETTSAALSFASYLLARNPVKQDKLLQEIDEFLPPGTEVTYDILREMRYLQMVVEETLRLFPIASGAVHRKCMEACEVNRIQIPEGTVFQVDVWSVHHDKDIWGEDAEQFIPERFSKEYAARRALAWFPFGVGPRNCVGLRFGLMETKLALAQLLRRVKIEECPETTEKFELHESATVHAKNGVFVKLVPREVE